jgi:hypothetical protein
MGQFKYIIIAIITYIIFRKLYLIYNKEKFTESYDENYSEEFTSSKIIEHPKDALIEGIGLILRYPPDNNPFIDNKDGTYKFRWSNSGMYASSVDTVNYGTTMSTVLSNGVRSGGWYITSTPTANIIIKNNVTFSNGVYQCDIAGINPSLISYTFGINLNTISMNNPNGVSFYSTNAPLLIYTPPVITIQSSPAIFTIQSNDRSAAIYWNLNSVDARFSATIYKSSSWTLSTTPSIPVSNISITNSVNAFTANLTGLTNGTSYTATLTLNSDVSGIFTAVTTPSFIPNISVTVGSIVTTPGTGFSATTSTVNWIISSTSTIPSSIQTGTAWNITTTPSISNISITNIGNNFTATLSGLTDNTAYTGSIKLNSSSASYANVTPTAFSVRTQRSPPYKTNIITPQPGTNTANSITFTWVLTSNIPANVGNIPILDPTILKGDTWNITTSPAVIDSVVTTTVISSTVNTINYSTTIYGLLPVTAYSISISPGSNANYITVL